MRETLPVSYMKCGFCTAKNHCAACGAELSQALLRKPGVAAAEVDLMQQILCVDCAMDREDLLDLLDGMGLVAE